MTSDLINRILSQRSQWLRWLKATARGAVDAEDLLQDIFYELILANRGAEQIENISRWVMRVAKNRVIDAARKRARDAAIDPEDISIRNASAADPESTYLNAVTDEHFRQALSQLPEAQRDVFVAHELEGEPFASIAARTGKPQNTLLAQKHYAVRKLRVLLGSIHSKSTNQEDDKS